MKLLLQKTRAFFAVIFMMSGLSAAHAQNDMVGITNLLVEKSTIEATVTPFMHTEDPQVRLRVIDSPNQQVTITATHELLGGDTSVTSYSILVDKYVDGNLWQTLHFEDVRLNAPGEEDARHLGWMGTVTIVQNGVVVVDKQAAIGEVTGEGRLLTFSASHLYGVKGAELSAEPWQAHVPRFQVLMPALDANSASNAFGVRLFHCGCNGVIIPNTLCARTVDCIFWTFCPSGPTPWNPVCRWYFFPAHESLELVGEELFS